MLEIPYINLLDFIFFNGSITELPFTDKMVVGKHTYMGQ
jgi:hypothetical protein